MSQSVPVQTTCPCSKKTFKDFKRHSKSKTHQKWVEDTLKETLPLLTPIDQLPPPPQWMLDDDDDDEPNVYYNIHKCQHCDYQTYDTDPDCIKCKKRHCMLAIPITDDEDSDDEPIQLPKPKDSDDEQIFKKEVLQKEIKEYKRLLTILDDDDDEPIQLPKPKKQIFTTFFEEIVCETLDTNYTMLYVNWKKEHDDIFNNDTRLLEFEPAVKSGASHNYYLLWVDDVKKYYKWKKGDIMFFTIKQNTDNVFSVFKNDDDSICDMKIDENGFVYYYDYYGRLGYVKVNSKYNDLIRC